MSATDELRKILDERGVAWVASAGDIVTDYTNDGFLYRAFTKEDGLQVKNITPMTPEQTIAATVGRETCHNAAPEYLDFLCSECGFVHYHSDENDDGDGNDWKYCPNCGRQVVR